ncbi:MAG: FkbM family methyltransferase [Chitinophagales bacterium]|nr:FkbM family methyltransferase [Chitinophagales bacterium]
MIQKIKKLIPLKLRVYISKHFHSPLFYGDSKSEIKRKAIFYNQFVQKDDLVFDVGANMGNRIAPMLNIGAKVVAVEPQEKCHQTLKSKYGNKIEIVTMGLDEQEGFQEFHIADTSTLSSFSTEWIDSVKNDRFSSIKWEKTLRVQMTTLDKLISTYGTPKFIKIDVEGYELNVLKGLTQPIQIISFEYTVPEQTQKVIDCIEQIEKHNNAIECNYSIGESMKLASDNWNSVSRFKEFVQTDSFTNTRFGDIYIRSKN